MIEDKLYAIGGIEDHIDVLNTTPTEMYDPENDTWLEIAALPGCRKQHAGATYGKELYVCGGLDWDEVLDSLLCYNADTNQFRTLAPMLTPRADHNMVAHEGKLYVAGGLISRNFVTLQPHQILSELKLYFISNSQEAGLRTPCLTGN